MQKTLKGNIIELIRKFKLTDLPEESYFDLNLSVNNETKIVDCCIGRMGNEVTVEFFFRLECDSILNSKFISECFELANNVYNDFGLKRDVDNYDCAYVELYYVTPIDAWDNMGQLFNCLEENLDILFELILKK